MIVEKSLPLNPFGDGLPDTVIDHDYRSGQACLGEAICLAVFGQNLARLVFRLI